MRFEAAFEGGIDLFGDSTDVKFERAALVIKVGTENSVGVEVAFTINVNPGDASPTFTGMINALCNLLWGYQKLRF